jgi:hypothetical protein
VLITSDRTSIRVNIVVLCRGCNAAKGQRGHMWYFSDSQREVASKCQRVLLDTLLGDEQFLKLVKKWGLNPSPGLAGTSAPNPRHPP